MSQICGYSSIVVVILLAIWTAKISTTPDDGGWIVDYPSDTHSGAENIPLIQLLSYDSQDKTGGSRASGKDYGKVGDGDTKTTKSRTYNDRDEHDTDEKFAAIDGLEDGHFTMEDLYAYFYEDDEKETDFDDSVAIRIPIPN